MAKYKALYSCGHCQEIELYGKIDERRRKLDWMTDNMLCPECFKGEAAKKASKHIAEVSSSLSLPALTGSEKQISWAEKIRIEAVESLCKGNEIVAGRFKEMVEKNLSTALGAVAIKKIFWGFTESKWWIDNRNTAIRDSIEKIMESCELVVESKKPSTKSEIMRRAWEIARAGAKKFGGSSKSFFAESLRQAWAEAKN